MWFAERIDGKGDLLSRSLCEKFGEGGVGVNHPAKVREGSAVVNVGCEFVDEFGGCVANDVTAEKTTIGRAYNLHQTIRRGITRKGATVAAIV